jgi:hypothetical protein
MPEYFTLGHSPDLKHFQLTIHDPVACATPKVQNHIYAAMNKFLRNLRQQAEKKHDTNQR